MSTRRSAQPFLVQLADLTRIELTNWRWTLGTTLVLGMITPLGSVIALSTLLRGARAEELGYVLAGNVVLSLMFENQLRVAGHFAFLKEHGMLDYFGTLPVRKPALMLAAVIAFLALSIPALLVTGLGGALVLHLSLTPSPALLIAIPLCVLPLSAIGALIGVVARTGSEANSLGIVATFVMAGVGAVVVPPERLPGWVVELGRLSPATYAGSALRQAMFGPVTSQFAIDVAALLGFSLLTFLIAARFMEWRQR
jgi:ABC-2 type transport system permease protein